MEGTLYMQIVGENNMRSAFRRIEHPNGRKICQRQTAEVVLLSTPFDLGDIKQVRIRLVGSKAGCFWYANRLRVTNLGKHFLISESSISNIRSQDRYLSVWTLTSECLMLCLCL